VEKALLAQKKMELESSNISVQKLHNDLNMAQKQITVLEQQMANLQGETKCLSETVSHLREDKTKLEAELEDQKRRNSSLDVASDSLFSLYSETSISMYHFPGSIFRFLLSLNNPI
jgi:predicted  nucleic acid-binding Zn-ribbon protein